MIDKKTIKKIRKGDHVALEGAIEELLNEFNDDTFNEGYRCCVGDLEIYANRLAERIFDEAKLRDKSARHNEDKYYLLELEETEQVIKDFYNELMDKNGKK